MQRLAQASCQLISDPIRNSDSFCGWPNNRTKYGYDAGSNGIGRLTSAYDANHSMAWSYDALGRVTGKSQIIGGITKAVGYGYANGDLASVVTPSGQTITYTYTNHRISSIKINGTTLLTGVTYDPFGPAKGWTWGNGTTTARTFDQNGDPAQIITAGVTNTYTMDDAQRITSITDSGLSSASFTYGYDSLDRVTSGVSSAVTRTYTWDADGNMSTSSGTTAISTTISGTSNRISALSGSPLNRSYSYDAAGNTTGFTGTTFTYNQRGRVTARGTTTNYAYNALGQLAEKYGSTGTTILMYDEAGRIVGEYSNTGALFEETVYLDDMPVATLRPNGASILIYYVHTDDLGTPRKVTRPSDNALVWRWDPDTFGSVAANANPSGLGTFSYNLRFPGQFYLAESGMHYNGFRMYDPYVGRYLQSDPIGLAGGGPDTYQYVLSNPLSLSDNTGLIAAGYHPDPPPRVRQEAKDYICQLLSQNGWDPAAAQLPVAAERGIPGAPAVFDPVKQEADDFLTGAGLHSWHVNKVFADIYAMEKKYLPQSWVFPDTETGYSKAAYDAGLAGINHLGSTPKQFQKWCQSCDLQ